MGRRHSVRGVARSVLCALVAAALGGCGSATTDEFEVARERLVAQTLAGRGIHDARVIAAMRRVPRHRFVPPNERARAYDDVALPIGLGQTISQPYVVAVMTQALGLDGHERVLEIGTGSGYQAAVLAGLCREVYSIEILEPLARGAIAVLGDLGYRNVHVRVGDGYRGWPDAAPFDAIIVTAAPAEVPAALRTELAIGGRMVLPVGTGRTQSLIVIERGADGFHERTLMPVVFVPMTGEAR
jgi:protein-L-isoaspartate(D-aspartate) O-methyltransferase